VAKQLQGAVLLIEIRLEAKGKVVAWAFATASALTDHTLLTTAALAVELARHRQVGRTLWASVPGTDKRYLIQELYIPKEYGYREDDESRHRFYDLALLTTESKLSVAEFVVPASSAELGQLKAGLPLACFGFAYEGVSQLLDTLKTEKPAALTCLLSGDGFSPVPSEQNARGLGLIELKAQMPLCVFGSPLVNAKGHVVAIHDDPLLPENPDKEPPGNTDRHYFTVVSRELLDSWLRGDKSQWKSLRDSPTTAAP